MLPIKAKSDVFEEFKNFKAYAENQSGHKIKILRDNKGGEYMSNAFSQYTTECIQITLGDDSQCTVIIVYLSNY